MSAIVELTAPNGDYLQIVQLDERGCAGCDRDGQVEVAVRRAGEWVLQIGLCGGCLAEGLSILLGRRHVQAGGVVEDLRDPSSDAVAPSDAISDDGMTSEGDPEPPAREPGTVAAAARGEDHGCCPNCEGTEVIAHENGVLECAATACGATWTGRRVKIGGDVWRAQEG